MFKTLKTTAIAVLAGTGFLLPLMAPAAPLAAAELTLQEARGKQIYREGTSAVGGDIRAIIGRGSVSVPGSVVPCANCHGEDGLGRPEGGVVPSQITWRHLTKAYGHDHDDGRVHPAFTEKSLVRALTGRIDPGGNELDVAMPQYDMSEGDLADLVAYMKRLETDLDPGLEDDVIRIGSILPLHGRLASLGKAMQATLNGYFEELNAQGGLFGRKLKLEVAEYSEDRSVTVANTKLLFEQKKIFALVSPFVAGIEDELFSAIKERGIPLVSPFTIFSPRGDSKNRFTFYLLSGLRDQARAMVDHSSRMLDVDKPRVVVVVPPGERFLDIADAVEAEGKRHGWDEPMVLKDLGADVESWRRIMALMGPAADLVFYLAHSSGFQSFAEAATLSGWGPDIFLSGLLADESIFDTPETFAGKLYVAYPTVPGDRTRDGVNELLLLSERHKIPGTYLAAQLSTYSAAKVLVAGLQSSGRALSREKLVDALEGLSDYDTGLTPPISFGPNRRVGALGAYVLPVDLKNKTFFPAGPWIPLGSR